jgi:hypothetical protein
MEEEIKKLRDQLAASERREVELMREAQGLRAAIGVCRSNCTDFGTRRNALTAIRSRSDVARDPLDQSDDASTACTATSD